MRSGGIGAGRRGGAAAAAAGGERIRINSNRGRHPFLQPPSHVMRIIIMTIIGSSAILSRNTTTKKSSISGGYVVLNYKKTNESPRTLQR